MHPNVLPVVEGVLDDGCLISSLSSIAICAGETPQPIHADDQLMPIPKPHPPTVCNTMWALTDFTEANGATRIIPGSHLADRRPTTARPTTRSRPRCRAAPCSCGTAACGTAAAPTPRPTRRVGIAMNYCAGYIRQQENQQLGIPRDVAAAFDERLQRLCGYSVYTGLIGHIDKHDPIELLQGERAHRMVWEPMATTGITDADERLHPIEDPSPHWSDSLYFNAWDPGTDTFVMTRIAVLGNDGRVTGGVIVWVDGELAYAYGRELQEIPPADWDVMTTDGLTYRMLQSGQAWAVQLADDDTKAHLEWHGLSPATSYDAHPAGPLPKAVAWGHYEQSCRVTGDLVRRRAHHRRSTGSASATTRGGSGTGPGLHQWHWVTGFLTDGRAFNLFEVHTHDDATTVNGFVHGPDGDDYVTAVDRVLDRADDGGAATLRMTLTTASGATLAVTGERAGASVPGAAGPRPARRRPRDADPARRRRRGRATASTSTSSPSSIDRRRPRRPGGLARAGSRRRAGCGPTAGAPAG